MPPIAFGMLSIDPLFYLVLATPYYLTASTAFGLQLRHHWKATPGAILSADIFSVPQELPHENVEVLATAGHSDGGSIRLFPLEECDAIGGVCSQSKVHNGSIFSLAHITTSTTFPIGDDEDIPTTYVVSGSFDRSAALHRVVYDNSNSEHGTDKEKYPKLRLHTIGRLPEHTGWVRQVLAVQHPTADVDANRRGNGKETGLSLLSIGCNLINVWSVDDYNKSSNKGNTIRMARLDAGPSPDDPPEEPFRRHDILSIAVIGDHCSPDDGDCWIVAGLVDGTIRVWNADFQYWWERRTSPMYDATGSCDCAYDANEEKAVQDEPPCVSVNAHEGRITCILAVLDETRDFISAGYDGKWIRWQIRRGGDGNDELSKMEEGLCDQALETTAEEKRICSVSIARQNGEKVGHELFLGTQDGHLLCVPLLNNAEPKLLWRDEVDDTRSISAIACKNSPRCVFACRSDGVIIVFNH